MKEFTRRSLVVLGLVLTVVGTASGNGYEFFAPPAGDRPLDLVYVGQIRDKSTGKLIRYPAYLMVTERRSGMTFPFGNDRPGHYRSPDVGASIKDLGGTVSANDLEVEAIVSGYKTARITKVPRKITGTVELNFELEPESSASAGPPLPSASNDSSSRLWVWLALGAVAIVIAGAAARTLALRQSTTR